MPLDHPGITINAIWTMGDERTNDVFFDDVFVPDDYVVGELNHGFQYISEALDLERFTMFTYSPIEQRLDLLCDYVAHRDRRRRAAARRPGRSASRSRGSPPRPRWRGCSACGSCAKSMKGGAPPTSEASEYKLFATELSKRLAERVDGHRRARARSCACDTEDAPMKGRAESTYRYTVIDTIGGGASEIQKNIIARRKLGLPKNF